jgi:hypothetical protein
MECSDRWNSSKSESIRVVDNWMDINKGVVVDKTQSRDWRRTIDSEVELSITPIEGIGVGGIFFESKTWMHLHGHTKIWRASH